MTVPNSKAVPAKSSASKGAKSSSTAPGKKSSGVEKAASGPLLGFDESARVPCAFEQSQKGREAAMAASQKVLDVLGSIHMRCAEAEIEEYFAANALVRSFELCESMGGYDEEGRYLVVGCSCVFVDGSECGYGNHDEDGKVKGVYRSELAYAALLFGERLLKKYPLAREGLLDVEIDRRFKASLSTKALADQEAYEIGLSCLVELGLHGSKEAKSSSKKCL